MRRFQTGRPDDTGVVGLLPTLNADAPVISRFEAGKAIFRTRRDQIVANGGLVLQEFVTELDADGVLAQVVGAGIALAVAIETGKRIGTASLQGGAENVLDHNSLG